MSQFSSVQQAHQYLNSLISRLYQAIQIKRNLYDAFQNIIPDPQSGILYIPLPQAYQFKKINFTWRNFYNKSSLNQILSRYQVSIGTDVDQIIGEAIHNGIQNRTGNPNPQPYEHQAEAIALALYALDELRNWLRSKTPLESKYSKTI